MEHSAQLFAEAKRYIPGGVNSPVRAFARVGGQPVFFKKGIGAWLMDEDGKRYIDYIGSWGPMIIGHAHPAVVKAVTEAVSDGLSFGTINVTKHGTNKDGKFWHRSYYVSYKSRSRFYRKRHHNQI